MNGSATWADITTCTPAAIAARKGTSSTESSRAQSALITGSARWESMSGVAMPGEMLGRRDHSMILEAADFGDDESADLGGALAERADVDDRIGRVVVDVGNGREAELDSHGAALPAP